MTVEELRGMTHEDLVRRVQELEDMGHRTKRFFQWSGKMGERF